MVGIVTIITEEENVFLIGAATDDAPPAGGVVGWLVVVLVGVGVFVVGDCLDFICNRIGAKDRSLRLDDVTLRRNKLPSIVSEMST